MRRRTGYAIALGLSLASSISLAGPAQARTVAQVQLARGVYGRLNPSGSGAVNVRQLGKHPSEVHDARAMPAILRHPKAATRRPTPLTRSSLDAAPSLLTPNTSAITTQGTTEEELTGFPGIDLATGYSLYGPDQSTEPPDTQIAVGPTYIVEMVNANLTIWTKAGARITTQADLNNLYAVGAGFSVTDPRLLYDSASGHFWASAFAVDSAGDSDVYLAMSTTSDPTSLWFHWLVKSTTAVVTDQPKLGYNDDKVTLSWGEFLPTPCQNQSVYYCFNGQATVVAQKSDLVTVPQNTSPHYFAFANDFTRFGIVPVQSLSSTSAQYMVYNNADPYNLVENQCATASNALYGTCPTLGIMTITGTPAGNNIGAGESDPSILDTTLPPNAVEKGTTTVLQTDDDRLQSAVWQNGNLWTTATDGNLCSTVKPTSEPPGSCARVIEASTTTMSILKQVQFGGSGNYFYYPAASPDSAGDAFVVVSQSSSSNYPGVWAAGFVASVNTWTSAVTLKAGTSPYVSGAGTTCGGQDRWGDYNAVALDPTDTTDVWVAGEWPSDPMHSCAWGTFVSRLTYSAPVVTSITPNTGPRNGGTAVTITGRDFLSGLTSVYIGNTPATSVVVQNPDQLTAVTPAGAWIEAVSASTPDGHGPYGPAFTYALRLGSGLRPAPHTAPSGSGSPPPVTQTTSKNRPPPPPSGPYSAGAALVLRLLFGLLGLQ